MLGLMRLPQLEDQVTTRTTTCACAGRCTGCDADRAFALAARIGRADQRLSVQAPDTDGWHRHHWNRTMLVDAMFELAIQANDTAALWLEEHGYLAADGQLTAEQD